MQIEDPDVLPQPIKDLVGLSFCFGVTLGSGNVSGGSEIFLVSQVLSGDKLLQIETSFGFRICLVHVTDGSSIMSGGEVCFKNTIDVTIWFVLLIYCLV